LNYHNLEGILTVFARGVPAVRPVFSDKTAGTLKAAASTPAGPPAARALFFVVISFSQVLPVYILDINNFCHYNIFLNDDLSSCLN
jgi:hypothetical protein